MEYRDTFTRGGVPTGRVIEKHAPLLDGEYLLHSELIMKTRDGLYVLQQRSLKAKWFAGKWDITGGGVQSGETSADAARREAFEEVGISARKEDTVFIERQIDDWENGHGLIVDIYAARVDIPEGGIKFDRHEVEAVRLVPFEEFCDNVMFNKKPGYLETLRKIERTI